MTSNGSMYQSMNSTMANANMIVDAGDGGPKMKQILHNLSGFARPKQILAIMGPSGGGKTSTLNILAQRLKMSPGAVFEGEVRANNRVLTPASFGKIGAYVWQQDVLVATMTPRELFVFAAKLRTNLNFAEIDDKVEDLLNRLGLVHCQNTKIGGILFKGLSGGEKKRASIGYELITEP